MATYDVVMFVVMCQDLNCSYLHNNINHYLVDRCPMCCVFENTRQPILPKPRIPDELTYCYSHSRRAAAEHSPKAANHLLASQSTE